MNTRLKYVFVILMSFACLSIFGQQPKKVATQGQSQSTSLQQTLNKQQETILQLQEDNAAMQKQLEKMEKEVELYREDVRSKISELDETLSRWLNILSIIMGLIGIVFGVVIPVILNYRNEKYIDKMLSDTKDEATSATKQAEKAEKLSTQIQSEVSSITKQVTDAKEQAEVATEQAKQAKQSLAEIEELKNHVSTLENKIYNDAIAAEKAAKEAEASKLFTQAFAEKDLQKAIELYTQAIELVPYDTDSYNNRGCIKNNMGNYKGALEDFNKAIDILYKNEIIRKERTSNGAYKTIVLNKNAANIFNNRAFTLKSLGHYNDALNDIGIAIEYYPDFHYFETRGEIYYAMGKYNEAISDFAQALNLNPKDIDSYTKRAECYRKLAETEQNPEKKADLIANIEADEKKAESLKNENKS